jgi:hypothetical protein
MMWIKNLLRAYPFYNMKKQSIREKKKIEEKQKIFGNIFK